MGIAGIKNRTRALCSAQRGMVNIIKFKKHIFSVCKIIPILHNNLSKFSPYWSYINTGDSNLFHSDISQNFIDIEFTQLFAPKHGINQIHTSY